MLISGRGHISEAYIPMVTFAELKCAEVDPCSASDLLVDNEFVPAAQVVHGIVSICRALRK